MDNAKLIPTTTLCSKYDIEISFMDEIGRMDLIQFEIVDHHHCIHVEHLGHLERILRLRNEFNMNLESIDIVFNLLDKERALKDEVTKLKNRLRLYEELAQ
ncbi:chaperone modulator CbpM [Dokdonia sp. Hel_I_53]|uniref:chaperone modulator CbpM n=1 Tax=Dokdonia sp. Hel_I_53 TaxID=1566287 RepID=UPI00119BFE33|nr:chaperone modulator CbpM [Dokdonia sp. Hel_I_53]TVZ51081.1 MerR-like DNA binding protein [Dokdonia sp. Hel_I_53]